MKKWLINLSLVLVFPVGILLLDGCYPNDSLTTEETDIVLTGYYDSVNFQSLKTYYMPDTVFPIVDDGDDADPINNQSQILATVASNMASYGWTRVEYAPDVPEPDVMIAVSAIITTNYTVGWWYPYYPGWGWGWGWGWYKEGSAERGTDYWYGGWGGYYPPGYGWGYVPYYSSYTTGTLLMEMTNPEDYRVINNDTVNPIYWAGGLNGILGSTTTNTARVESGIDQAFEQSPYLKLN
jgi:hypothetical protein